MLEEPFDGWCSQASEHSSMILSRCCLQVLGHMKTILVLLLGWLLFNSKITLKLFGGMVIAVVGMILYSWAVEKAKKQEKEAQDSKTQMTAIGESGSGEKAPLIGGDVEAGKGDK